MSTFQDAINLARGVLVDTDPMPEYRYSDADLLRYANDALDAIAVIKPELFYETVEITCIAGTTVQKLPNTGSLGLVDVFQVKNGPAIREADRGEYDALRPNWHTDTAAAAQAWMRMGKDPYRFYIHPKAPVGQVLIGLHVAAPGEHVATDTIPLAPSYAPLIADYIVGMAEARDDEHVNANRAQAFMLKFAATLGAGKKMEQ